MDLRPRPSPGCRVNQDHPGKQGSPELASSCPADRLRSPRSARPTSKGANPRRDEPEDPHCNRFVKDGLPRHSSYLPQITAHPPRRARRPWPVDTGEENPGQPGRTRSGQARRSSIRRRLTARRASALAICFLRLEVRIAGISAFDPGSGNSSGSRQNGGCSELGG
jgi:hypothetical protein